MTRLGPPRFLVALCAVALTALAAWSAPASAKSGPALPPRTVQALIELQHPQGLNRFVRKVSDPRSPRYRHYATVEKLVARYGAKPKTRKRVLRWLRRHGVAGRVSASGTFVTAALPPALAARLDSTAGPAGTRARTALGSAVPASLRGAVARITLVHRAPVVLKAAAANAAATSGRKHPYTSVRSHSGTASGCRAGRNAGDTGEPFTPNQYLTAYGHARMQTRGLRGEGQTVALVELGGGFRRSDVATFAKCFGLKVPPIRTIPVGPKQPHPPEDETTLDLSILTAGAPGLDRILVYQGSEAALIAGMIETAGAALGSRGHRPDVISISLGACEPELGVNLAFRNAFNDIFAVAAGAGISVLVAAGDEGSTACGSFIVESGEETYLPLLTVSVPSSSPYVTAVGGTNLILDKHNRIRNEIVWNDQSVQPSGGGGGNSLLSVGTPWWQPEFYGEPGRKVPDIAALGDIYPGYALYCTAADCEPNSFAVRGWRSVGGTSAAAPLMAAGIALANQYAAKRGQRPLGFLNPLVYQLGADRKQRRNAFNDVVKGNNDISRLLPLAPLSGILPLGCCSARRGYDWASGWGSLKVPAFAKLAAAAAR